MKKLNTPSESTNIKSKAGLVVLKRLPRRKVSPDFCPECKAQLEQIATFVPPSMTGEKNMVNLEEPGMDGYRLAEKYATMEMTLLRCERCKKMYETHEVEDYDWWATAELDTAKMIPLVVGVVICNNCHNQFKLSVDPLTETSEEAVHRGFQAAEKLGWKHVDTRTDYCPNCHTTASVKPEGRELVTCFRCETGTFGCNLNLAQLGLPAHLEDAEYGRRHTSDPGVLGFLRQEPECVKWILCNDCAKGHIINDGTDYKL